MSSGVQLARARGARGYTQEDAAAALGVNRVMISYWESDRRTPNTRQLVALARLYAIPLASLTSSDAERAVGETAAMLFRGAEVDLPQSALPGLHEFESFLDGYADLAEASSTALHGLTVSPFNSSAGFDTADDARRKAEEVRSHLRVGLGPISDVDAVCDLMGVTVFRSQLGSDLTQTVSGAFFNHPRVGFSILVNLEMTTGRRRFTVAHELAHALFHSDQVPYVVSSAFKDAREKFADTFGGEFLMPTEGLRRAMEEYGIGPRVDDPADVVHLQRFFKTSYDMTLVRLRQARLISKQHYETFRQTRPVSLARALGYDVDEHDFGRDPQSWGLARFPPRFLRLVRRAVRAQVVSVTTVASRFGLLMDEVADLVSDRQATEPSRELIEFEDTGVPG